jgi:hypothetical protein
VIAASEAGPGCTRSRTGVAERQAEVAEELVAGRTAAPRHST